MDDISIERLIVEPDRAGHIAGHRVTPEEVREIFEGDYVILKGRLDRWGVIGQTKVGRFLTIIVGERSQPNTFGLASARGHHDDERRFYLAQFPEKGGGTS